MRTAPTVASGPSSRSPRAARLRDVPRRVATVLGLCLLALAAAGTSKPKSKGKAGVELLETTHAAYVGNWEGKGTSLRIAPDGSVAYERKDGAVKKSVNGKLARFDGHDIVVSALLEVKLDVSSPPSESDGTWTMKVEGRTLHRVGDGRGEGNDIDEKLEEHIVERYGASKGIASVSCPEVEPSDKAFDCDAKLTSGKVARVSVRHEARGNYAYTVHVVDVDGPVFAADLSKKVSAAAKRKVTVDCGREKIFLPEGEPLTCAATDGKKTGEVVSTFGTEGVEWKLTGL